MNRKQTAYHEAGHGVVGYRLGYPMGLVSCIPNKDQGTLGTTGGDGPALDGSEDEDFIVGLYAGGAAQRRLDPTTGDDGCWGDNEKAAEFMRPHPELNEEELRRRADELVAKHWAEIEAVAAEAFEWGALLEDEAETICDAMAEGRDWREALSKMRFFLGDQLDKFRNALKEGGKA